MSAEDVDGDDRDDGEGGDLGADRLMVDERDRLPRRHREGSNRSDSDQRSSSQRDLARVLYSPYFQRLSGVTQIISPDPRVPQLHNRQTHSLKVALVSSEVAEEVIRQARTSEKDASAIKALGGIDSVICEVAGLAHDLGHPPFGHLGESLLDQFMRYEGPFPLAQGDKEHQEEAPSQADVSVEDDALAVCKTDAKASFGFEGNAQSFRIVTRLDRHKVAATPGSPLVGLDLTSASLAAILKYPWWRSSVRGPGPKEKYNVYPEDVATFIRARRWTLGRVGLHQQTLEASIMDLADDITYAVHDLQDFIFAGMVDSRDVVKMLRQQEILMGNAGYTDFAGNDKRLIEERLLLERQKDRVAPALEEAYRRAAAAQAGFANRDDYVKALAWAIALGSGTSGGVLAPLIIMGGALGAIEAQWIPSGDVGLWVMISMAAMMGGTMRAPLTAMVFTLELTHDLNVLPALLLSCIAAHGVTVLLLRRSILTEKVARHGHHLIREYSVDPLEVVRVGEVMDRNVPTIPATMTVAEFAERLEHGDPKLRGRQGTPIVDKEGRVVGIITRTDLMRAEEQNQDGNLTVLDIGSHNLVVAYPDESLRTAVTRMLRNDIGRLVVVSRQDPHRLLGYIARSGILAARQEWFKEELSEPGWFSQWRGLTNHQIPGP